jgi:hypothetical protein
METRFVPPACLALTAAVAFANGSPASAAETGGSAAYLITSTLGATRGSFVTQEVLAVQTSQGKALVTLALPGGRSASAIVAADDRGILPVAGNDPAIACYNTAQNLLAAAAGRAPQAVTVGIGGSAVAVPVRIAQTTVDPGTLGITVDGSVAGRLGDAAGTGIALAIDGALTETRAGLLGARIREASVVAATGAIIGESTCTIAPMGFTPAQAPI